MMAIHIFLDCWETEMIDRELQYTQMEHQQQPIILIYNKFCPFAQRALLTAIQKNVPATFKQVSLGQKGEFFSKTYQKALGHDPTSDGKVPILIHGEQYLTESEPVCWYLAETFSSGSNLIPTNTFQRARMRLFIAQECSQLIALFNRFKLKQVPQSIELARTDLKRALWSIENSIKGDYLLGSTITLADIMIYPWFERWIIIEHNFQVGLEGYPRIQAWLMIMTQRKSVQETSKMTTREYYISRSQKMMAAKL